MVPSLVVVVVTGLLLMGLNRTFGSAGWVWIKALIGLLLVKAVITINDPAAREIAAMVGQGIATANADALAELARLTRMEWLGSWLALALAIAAIGFGVWRPRFSEPQRRAEPAPASDAATDERLEDAPVR
jgi:hypothetical protein